MGDRISTLTVGTDSLSQSKNLPILRYFPWNYPIIIFLPFKGSVPSMSSCRAHYILNIVLFTFGMKNSFFHSHLPHHRYRNSDFFIKGTIRSSTTKAPRKYYSLRILRTDFSLFLRAITTDLWNNYSSGDPLKCYSSRVLRADFSLSYAPSPLIYGISTHDQVKY